MTHLESNKPQLVRKGQGNAYETTCKLCGYGIFAGQPRQWSSNPTGLVHTACVTS